MPVADLRELFDVNFPGQGEMNPNEIFKKLLNEKRHGLVNETTGKLRNIRKKVTAVDLIANVKLDNLEPALGDKESVTVQEIVAMLPQLL